MHEIKPTSLPQAKVQSTTTSGNPSPLPAVPAAPTNAEPVVISVPTRKEREASTQSPEETASQLARAITSTDALTQAHDSLSSSRVFDLLRDDDE